MKDIATAVGISEPAVYRHFSSKAELIWQIFVEGYCGLAEEIEGAANAQASLRGKIDSIIAAYCRLHDTNMPLFRFLFLTQHGQLSKMTADMPSPVDVVLKVIESGMETGEIPKGNATLMTALLFGLVTQPAIFHIYGRLPDGMNAYMPALSKAAWAVIA